MRNTMKPESEEIGGRRESDDVSERQSKSGAVSVRPQEEEQIIDDRRAIRSQYLALIHKMKDSKDYLTRIDSDDFNRIFDEVGHLHQQVQKPREQVADAEALLELANTLVTSVKSHSACGLSPAEFVNALIRGFGESSLGIDDADENTQVSVKWKDIGFDVCSSLMVSFGCSTMMGPMDTELIQRKKAVGYRKRTNPGAGVKPEEVDDSEAEKMSDTDNNIAIMFTILRKNKRVKIENLVLNRRSFPQTVENLFALSFLVKDGRVEIIVEKKWFFFCRKAGYVRGSSDTTVVYNHFVFRYDYKAWKLMSTMVAVGEELMPHRKTREVSSFASDLASKQVSQDSQTTPERNVV